MAEQAAALASFSAPYATKGLHFVTNEFVKTVVGHEFYTKCTTDAYIRAILDFCVEDVKHTDALVRRIKVVNHANATNNTLQFTKHEYRVIGNRIKMIDQELRRVSTATLEELRALETLRREIVMQFESGSYDGLDRALTELYRQITTMNVQRVNKKPKQRITDMIMFAAMKLVQWHFLLLSLNLVEMSDTSIQAASSFLEGWGVSTSLTRNVLVPMVTTGLVRSEQVWGKQKFVVTPLFTHHPWRSFVATVVDGASSVAGMTSKAAMSAMIMGYLREPTVIIMMLFLFFVGVMFHPTIMKTLRKANISDAASQGAMVMQRALAMSRTSISHVYAKTVRYVAPESAPGLRYHTKKSVKPFNNSARLSRESSSEGSITSYWK